LCCRWGEKGRHATEKRNRGEREVEFSQGLMRNFRKLQGSVGKTKFPVDLKPNGEMPKTKVGEFFKLYNIALGLKFKNLKLIFLHVDL
jgi:hypothetical protein